MRARRSCLRTHAMVLTRRSPETFPALARTALLSHPDGLAQHLERVLLTLETLNEQIKLADKDQYRLAAGSRESVRFLDIVTWPGAEAPVPAITDGHARSVSAEESALRSFAFE
jgi:hypothetical protein